MAIKGKKKSQSRGSQGVRRPAAAPRPTVSTRRKTSFWRTRDGMLIAGIFLLVAIGVVVWLVMSAQDRAEERELKATEIDTYTDTLQPALESVTPTANQMNEITTVPEGDDLEALAKDTKQWITDLQAAQALVQQSFAPEAAQPVNDLVAESITLYISAAETFALVPDAEGRLQDDIFTRATEQRDSAAGVLAGAIDALDSLRAERGLSASGLVTPGAPQPEAQPTTIITPEMELTPAVSPAPGTEDEGGGNDNKGGNDNDGN